MGLQLGGVILKQTVERFDMSLGLDDTVNMKKQCMENFYYYAKARLISFTQSTNIDKVEIFCLRTQVLIHDKVALLRTWRHSELGTRNRLQ